MLDLAKSVLVEFAAFRPAFDPGDTTSIFRREDRLDSHRAADEFIAASPAERDCIRARYAGERAQQKQAVATAAAAAPRFRQRRKGGQPVPAHTEQVILELAARGFSAREIERHTGVGRATVGRRLAGIAVQRVGRKRAA